MANLLNEKFFLKLIGKGYLKVTKDGRAFNLISGKEIAKTSPSDDYRKVSWQHPKTKKIKQIQLHRLVWAHFKGVPNDSSLQINHKDGHKQNCELKNLELTNNSGNAQHAHDIGLQPSCKGERNSQAKFRDSQVSAIRKRFALHLVSVELIASRFNVHKLTVVSLLSGKTYSHVESGYEEQCRHLLKSSRTRIHSEDITKVKLLRSKGLSSYSISEKTGLARNTVMKYW